MHMHATPVVAAEALANVSTACLQNDRMIVSQFPMQNYTSTGFQSSLLPSLSIFRCINAM